jgi:uncharacterized membrane protein HdeD (DUF308 family)
MTTTSQARGLGIVTLAAGVAEIINAFQLKSWGKFFLGLSLGVLYVLGGIVTFENPLSAAALLKPGTRSCVGRFGITRIILAFSRKEGMPGAITILPGGVIPWPA